MAYFLTFFWIQISILISNNFKAQLKVHEIKEEMVTTKRFGIEF